MKYVPPTITKIDSFNSVKYKSKFTLYVLQFSSLNQIIF